MNWTHFLHEMNTDVKNRLNNGDKFIFHKLSHIKNKELHEFYHTIIKLKPTSIYEVGFGLGTHLINLSNLCHWQPKIIGCELTPMHVDYAQNYFNILNYDIELELGDYRDLPHGRGQFDLIIMDNLLNKMDDHQIYGFLTKSKLEAQNIVIKGISNPKLVEEFFGDSHIIVELDNNLWVIKNADDFVVSILKEEEDVEP